jgi:hypothetical protein
MTETMMIFDLDKYDFSDFYINTCSCCGIGELAGIQSMVGYCPGEDQDGKNVKLTPRMVIEYVKTSRDYKYAALIFSEATGQGNDGIGDRLARYIRLFKLGRVRATGWNTNGNTGNSVKMFTWEPNWNKIDIFTGSKPVKKSTAKA